MNLAATYTNDAGLRKAAVVVASLDHLSADLLLDCLDADQADIIRRAVVELGEIDDSERCRVIDEFRRIAPMVPDNSPAGIELTNLEFTNSSLGRDESLFSSRRSTGSQRPFDFLCDAEDENLARLLADERPRTIAAVLSHLPSERAAEMLDRIAPAAQVEVVRCLVDLDNTDAESLREIERALEMRLAELFDSERRRDAGPQSVARMLESCESSVRRRILDNIAATDRPLAEQFGRREPCFDDVSLCSDAVLAEIFRTVGPEVFDAAALGMPPGLLERFLGCMEPEESLAARRRLACPGPIRLSDVEEARHEIALAAERFSTGQSCRTAA